MERATIFRPLHEDAREDEGGGGRGLNLAAPLGGR